MTRTRRMGARGAVPGREPARRRLSRVLMRCAVALMPAGREDWVQAMRAELDHVGHDRHSMDWALGCVLAAFKERMTAMVTGDLRISRWVLAPEMLLCFGPLTLGFVGALYWVAELAQVDAAHFHKYFIADPGGRVMLIGTPFMVVLTAIGGPLALAVAGRCILRRRALRAGWLGTALVAAPLLIGAGEVVLRVANSGLAAFTPGSVDAFDFWSGLLLLSLLPALGALHLRHLGAPPSASPGAASHQPA
ncbi:MAG TPA: hypothetical protein VMB48_09065 [Steroidobacteraceae bacterium]|nr:hypothetical protein [Steroidobacteraceae bacterium]